MIGAGGPLEEIYDSIMVVLLLFLGMDIWGSLVGLGGGAGGALLALEVIGKEVLGTGTAGVADCGVVPFSVNF